jgi:hypothetical protein
MAYLYQYDYIRQIQAGNLAQIVNNNNDIRKAVELSAQAEAISYLAQKYEVNSEFTDISVWAYTNEYKGAQRVYLDSEYYKADTSYSENDICLYDGNVYIAIDTTTGVFKPDDWTLLGKQGDLFYAKFPESQFNIYKRYSVGDKVFWRDKIYECKQNSASYGQEAQLQFGTYGNVPLANQFPDSLNQTQWLFESDYVIEDETLITDTDYWTKGDNRDQQMVMYFIDITLFHLHSRIAPQNIPQLRTERYDASIAWLKMCAKGDVTPNLQKIQPNEGMRIRWGGNVRNQNNY